MSSAPRPAKARHAQPGAQHHAEPQASAQAAALTASERATMDGSWDRSRRPARARVPRCRKKCSCGAHATALAPARAWVLASYEAACIARRGTRARILGTVRKIELSYSFGPRRGGGAWIRNALMDLLHAVQRARLDLRRPPRRWGCRTAMCGASSSAGRPNSARRSSSGTRASRRGCRSSATSCCGPSARRRRGWRRRSRRCMPTWSAPSRSLSTTTAHVLTLFASHDDALVAAARARRGQRAAAPGHPLLRQRGRDQRAQRGALRHGRLPQPQRRGRAALAQRTYQPLLQPGPPQADRLRRSAARA